MKVVREVHTDFYFYFLFFIIMSVFLTVTYAVAEFKILMLSRLIRGNSLSDLDLDLGGEKHFAKPP